MPMSENQKKFWKLALIAVPVIVSNIGSYAKSRAEAKDESKASYEAMRTAFAEMKKDTEENHDDVIALEARVAMLMDLVEKSSAHSVTMMVRPAPTPVAPTAPMVLLTKDAGTDGDGIPDHPRVHRKAPPNAAMPANFEDVVQQYKAKK